MLGEIENHQSLLRRLLLQSDSLNPLILSRTYDPITAIAMVTPNADELVENLTREIAVYQANKVEDYPLRP